MVYFSLHWFIVRFWAALIQLACLDMYTTTTRKKRNRMIIKFWNIVLVCEYVNEKHWIHDDVGKGKRIGDRVVLRFRLHRWGVNSHERKIRSRVSENTFTSFSIWAIRVFVDHNHSILFFRIGWDTYIHIYIHIYNIIYNLKAFENADIVA